MSDQIRDSIDEIATRGYSKLSGLVSSELVDELIDGCAVLLDRPSASWQESFRFSESGEWRSSYFADEGRERKTNF